MAEENVVTSPEANPAADSHKRKLEDLELNAAPEPLIDSEPVADRDEPQEEENGCGADDSEPKRPRLESNGDSANEEADNVDSAVEEADNVDSAVEEAGNVDSAVEEAGNGDSVVEVDGQVSENGHQEDEEGEPKEKESAEPKSADDSGQPLEEQESVKDAVEETAPNDDEKTEIGSADELGQQDANANTDQVGQPDANTDEVGQSDANTDELGQPNAGIDQPSDLPREGDVPVQSDGMQSGSDTQILSRKMDVPNDKVGVLIGKAGDTIRSLQDNSGAKIQIMRDADADPKAATRPLELVGTLENINKAEKLIKDVIAEADAGGSPSLVARGFSAAQAASGGEQVEIQVPIEKVGLIIGKGGETIRSLQTRSGARIQLIQQSPSDGDQSRERIVRVTGNKKQIETAREMIKDVMSQTIRPSPLSSGYSQQGNRARGPVASQWGPRGPHHAQFSGYDYPQRGPYPSPNSQYPPPSYGNYPPPQAPRSNYGPSLEQRPPASMHGPSPQGNYNYGQQPGHDYGHPSYSQAPGQPYGHHGYNDVKYDQHASSQHFGHIGSQPTPYAQGGTHSGYGPPDQYGKPPMYGMQPQVPHSQHYSQPRPSQPGEVPYQGPPSAQSYGQNMPPQQQSYPYASSGHMQQQSYPPYGSVPNTDGYGHTPAPTASAGYGQSVAGYGQPGAQQPPSAYPQAGGGYGSYPTAQPGYAEQPPSSTAAYGGYPQGPTDPTAYGGSAAVQGPVAGAYPATGPGQPNYAQPAQTQPGYDLSGGYGNVPAQAGYGKSVSPQAGYPQYDTSQMYGGHR